MLKDLPIQRFIDIDNNKIAFSELYESHVNMLFSYGVSLGFSDDTCKDAIQDVFFNLYLTKNKLGNIDNVKFYLLRSLKNRLITIQNHDKYICRTDTDISDLPFKVEVTVMDTIIDKEEKAMMKKKVEMLLNQLTDRQREAVYLRYMQELEYDEIAQLLNMSPESARKLVFRGMDSLRQQVKTDPELTLTLLFIMNFFVYN